MKQVKYHKSFNRDMMLDIACTEESDVVQVEVQDRRDKKILYIHIGGKTVCRISQIDADKLEITQ